MFPQTETHSMDLNIFRELIVINELLLNQELYDSTDIYSTYSIRLFWCLHLDSVKH